MSWGEDENIIGRIYGVGVAPASHCTNNERNSIKELSPYMYLIMVSTTLNNLTKFQVRGVEGCVNQSGIDLLFHPCIRPVPAVAHPRSMEQRTRDLCQPTRSRTAWN